MSIDTAKDTAACAASRVHLSRLDGPIRVLQVLMRTGLQLPQNLLDQLNETPGDLNACLY